MKKNAMYILSFLLVGLVLMSFNLKTKETYYGSVAKDGFKNLKILPQSISKDSLMNLMEGYNKALGVKCNHCHVMLDKSSDKKHEKEVARHMIKFTDELNAKEFAPIGEKYKNAIECATCHRGSTKPMDDTNAFMSKK
ncbi:c-type cytochrome [Flavobacterium sp. xlx-214]|uniref:c-type cytochrome n=1 Tax=unclassified Flavobacterium TaxID=196869 RepID=UPI0013D06F50|nr:MULTISPECIES: c-type cytochrome [unclassified Flavobacterium]MBA5792030.1 c-type cytochrome [Flavobacterium sp. xlx-221]QMI84282.1 c-type cytochrome [Flavobacterium sp. xlx-214]